MIRAAILLALLQLVASHSLPSTWATCHRTNPDLNNCIKSAVQGVILPLTTGVPELGVPPIDPMAINEMEVHERGRGGPVSLKITFTNAHLHGLAESTIAKFDAYLDEYHLDGETFTPKLFIQADYNMNGKILVFPVTGKGKCNLTMVALKGTHDLRGKPITRDGKLYMEVQEFHIKLQPKKMITHFENLFNGDKTLGETLNKVINENWLLIFNELRESLEAHLSVIFRDYANQIFKKVPFDDIFLP